MDFSSMSLRDVRDGHGLTFEESQDCPGYQTMFMGKDVSDRYAIIREFTDNDEDNYHFVFFTQDDLSAPLEHRVFKSPAEAALFLGFRFVLDNGEDLDSLNERDNERHDDIVGIFRSKFDIPLSEQVA